MRRLALFLPLLLTALPGITGGKLEGTELADRLYVEAKYRDAAEQYSRALTGAARPSDAAAAALYNRGNALYRLGEFSEARDSYEQAAMKTRNLDVEGRATYNIGNCYFREAEAKVRAGNLQDAAASLESSIAAYRRALELSPSRREAATNLEVARIVLKGVRDEIAKYGDLQGLQREIVEKLKALIATQGSLIDGSEKPKTSTAELRDAQERMRGETVSLLGLFDNLLGRLERLQGKSQEGNPYTAARRFVAGSEAWQRKAVATLSTGDRAGASGAQRDSKESLEKALEILTPPSREDRNEQGRGESGSGDERGSPPQEQGGGQGTDNPQPSPLERRADQGADSGQGAADQGSMGASERAEDILQEEGDNRRTRDSTPSGQLPVDKDW